MEKEKEVAEKAPAKPKSPTKTTKKPAAKTTKTVAKPKAKSNKIAVILTGGKQYLVKEGDALKIEKVDNLNKDQEIVFDKVLLIADDKGVKIGNDLIEGAKVTAKSAGNIRDKKITVIKYKRKTRYRVKRGHRQTYTHAVVMSIK